MENAFILKIIVNGVLRAAEQVYEKLEAKLSKRETSFKELFSVQRYTVQYSNIHLNQQKPAFQSWRQEPVDI